MWLSDQLYQITQRTLDVILGVNPAQVMNHGSSKHVHDDLAGELFLASKTLLAEGIDAGSGSVNYAKLRHSETYNHFKDLTHGLSSYPLQELGAGARAIAFWLNIYNAMIIDAIIHFNLQKSMLRTPGIFRKAAYKIDGMRFSADDIENGILRRNQPNPVLPLRPFPPDDPRRAFMVQRLDPRIHFALVCGAMSCPPIAYYKPDNLDAQLEMATANFINSEGVYWEPEQKTLWLSKIFKWYELDFGGIDGVLDLIRRHSRNEIISQLPPQTTFAIRFLPYDWSINQTAGMQ
jgi:hypothetical protein